ncbi:DUF6527 family protein [Microbacterium sp. NPDC077663]|uniref:DUF6527 family protein n=1 Tax=Microbacterium sp. NPDC077663 TaxID=3364189 RepID=UPI0037C82792
MKTLRFDYRFVEEIPAALPEGVLFVSTDYATAVHLCACGCGVKVVTPLAPSEWSITFNGVAVGLSPSIGNWSFPCRSHYWIRDGRVIKAAQWSDKKIQANRDADNLHTQDPDPLPLPSVTATRPRRTRLLDWFRRRV